MTWIKLQKLLDEPGWETQRHIQDSVTISRWIDGDLLWIWVRMVSDSLFTDPMFKIQANICIGGNTHDSKCLVIRSERLSNLADAVQEVKKEMLAVMLVKIL